MSETNKLLTTNCYNANHTVMCLNVIHIFRITYNKTRGHFISRVLEKRDDNLAGKIKEWVFAAKTRAKFNFSF